MVAIAIPASCVGEQTCASLEQATYTLYEISRACALFNVSEVIVYSHPDEDAVAPAEHVEAPGPKKLKLDDSEPAQSTNNASNSRIDPDLIFSANMLQYLIRPPYLRKLLFKPIGNPSQFKYASKFPAIPGISFPKNVLPGIAVPRARRKRLPGQKKLSKKDRKESGQTPYVNLGFDRLFKLKNEATVPVHSQVFVNFGSGERVDTPVLGKGYTVRAVTEFSNIFTQSPIKDGYSQTIYAPSQQFKSNGATHPLMQQVDISSLPDHDKLLIVFGKWSEVQAAVKSDSEMELEDASELFDGVKLGTERARLEDSVMITLARS